MAAIRSAISSGSLRSLVEAGVGMIQLRDKQLDDRELVDRARLLAAARRAGTAERCAIINDRADIAAAVDADGVHVGQEDLTVKDARAIVGTRMLIGVSTHNIEQARAAVLDGANYLGAGPTFASQTKSFDDFAGLDYLREVASEIRLPTFAIGGHFGRKCGGRASDRDFARGGGGGGHGGGRSGLRGAGVVGYAGGRKRIDALHTVAEATSPSLTSDL